MALHAQTWQLGPLGGIRTGGFHVPMPRSPAVRQTVPQERGRCFGGQPHQETRQGQLAFRNGEPYLPTLAALMGVTQLRHFKLWYAGEVQNWDLAKYELDQIQASIQDAARDFPNIPAANMTI